MNIRRKAAWRCRFCATLIALLFSISTAALAQTPKSEPAQAQPTPSPSPTPSLEKKFVTNILRDQRAIWLSPFSTRRSDLKWLAPLGLSTAILIGTDRRTSGELIENGGSQTRLNVSHDIARLGSFYSVAGIAAGFYFVGRAKGDLRARETGLLSAEALIDAGIVTSVLKLATQRPRPFIDNGRGDFRDDGNSFPSGHATSAWALAAVVAQEYKHRPLIKWSAYALAATISASRYTGRNHFLSDVVVGGAIGYGIGRYVYHEHHDKSLDPADDGATKTSVIRSKLLPFIAPQYSRVARIYGVSLVWSF